MLIPQLIIQKQLTKVNYPLDCDPTLLKELFDTCKANKKKQTETAKQVKKIIKKQKKEQKLAKKRAKSAAKAAK